MKYILFLAITFAFIACDNDTSPATENMIENTQVVPQNILQPAETNKVDTVQNPVLKNTSALPVITAAKSTAGLNPAHGQPGHRCDISVGAPLDSKPGTQPSTITSNTIVPSTNTTTPPPINITPQTPAQAVAPGMNPAHGQPGHRCDIAVGAPLNSKPAVTPVVPTAPAVPIVPVKTDSTGN